MTVALNLESDLNVSEHTKNAKDHNKVNYEFKIEGTPLNNLLIKYKAPKLIDFFSLDVEGVEYEVLTGIDHSTYRFKYILVEFKDFKKITYRLNHIKFCNLKDAFNKKNIPKFVDYIICN